MKIEYVLEIQDKRTLEWTEIARHWSREWIKAMTLGHRRFNKRARFRKVLTQN